MAERRWKILLIEDSPGDVGLIREEFSEARSPSLELEHAARMSAGLERLSRGGIDAILLDLDLPDSSGLPTFLTVHSKAPDVPILVLTGHQDEELALRAVVEGAQDYLFKGQTGGELLSRSIRYAISRHQATRELRGYARELQQAEARFRGLVGSLADGVVVVSPGGPVLYVNPAAKMIFGHRLEQLPEGLLGGPVVSDETTEIDLTDANGVARTLQMRGVETEWEGKASLLISLRDVTERKRIEREVLQISEREQTRIGQELHDSLGQHLTGTAFLAEAHQRRLAADSPEEASEAGRIAQLIYQAIDKARDLARGLYPVHLDRGGFLSALRDLALRTESLFNVSCKVESGPEIGEPGQSASVHLYRIAQEAVSNAVRHGRATNIRLGLVHEGSDLILTIQDDGVGAPEGIEADRGMGLPIMKYRAGMIGGNLDIHGTAGGGTVVTVRFPLTH